ncbi:MAG: D-tyrosyl-tRNA(Tyr) deacylase [Anaerolineales bacterium]|nr:D-tyrosyl-tRNA(Tyr) deacylase [Anaerolineales bacterium]
MKAVIQRVKNASVSVDGDLISKINQGVLVLLGIAPGDTVEEAEYIVRKTIELRIFEDEDGKMNRSLLDEGGEALVVSQFTLYADTRKGRRPSFTSAASPDLAESLVGQFSRMMRARGINTYTGVFGAYMQVELTNDGPVTIILEKDHN